ncbi:hypothetical protein TA3x_004358 [Tundrisphaera sp. TA3]|uniref:hypothetical protein n=1 Tax=Tundrisphaera sp. TA3 TaxID=3435775 RepID=UPI003EB84F5A
MSMWSRAGRLRRSVVAGLLGLMFSVMGLGCNQGTQIPLADVPPPPAVDTTQRKKVATPNGGSPDVLVYPASN